MKILCTIRRAHGTQVVMPDDGTEINFQPNEHGDHVAEVVNLEHAQRLLAIDVYKAYGNDAEDEAAAIVAADNELTELEQEMDPDLAPDLANMTMEELQAEYHHRFGRAAPPLIKYDTLLKKLAAARMDANAQE